MEDSDLEQMVAQQQYFDSLLPPLVLLVQHINNTSTTHPPSSALDIKHYHLLPLLGQYSTADLLLPILIQIRHYSEKKKSTQNATNVETHLPTRATRSDLENSSLLR